MTFQRICTALALAMLLAAWTLIITASLAHATSGRAHDISNPGFQKCLRMARHASTCRRLWGKRSELTAPYPPVTAGPMTVLAYANFG